MLYSEVIKMKRYALLFLMFLLLTNCSPGYVNTDTIPLSRYEEVIMELDKNTTLVDSLFRNENIRDGIIVNIDSAYIRIPANVLFKTKKLFEDDLACSININSERCIFFVLKIHSGIATTERECLKKSTVYGCFYPGTDSENITFSKSLSAGWEYQRVGTYDE